MRAVHCRFVFPRKGAGLIAGSLLFCTGPGPGGWSGGGIPSAAAAEDPPAVTFAAWNLRNYLHTSGAAPPPRKGAAAPKPAHEVAAVTRVLVSLNPDILGVCEMGTPDDLAALQQRLKDAGLDLPHSEYVQAADTERHLALLSRFPIAARHSQTKLTYLLDETVLPIQRGLLDVTIQVSPDYQLRCLGTHLKSRRDVPEADEALMRRNEAHLLRRHADAILTDAPETNLLVYGDCNDTRDNPTVKAISGDRSAATSLTPVAPVDDAGERWTYYFQQNDTYSRIDFLFASRALNPELQDNACRIYSGTDWFQASDHRAITAVIHAKDKKVRERKEKAPESDDNGK